MVIQLGNHYLIERSETTADGAGNMEGEGRHVRAERDVVRRSVEKVGEYLSRLPEHCIGFDAGGIGPVRVGVMPQQVIGHRLRHRPRYLRAARPIEVRHRRTVVFALERRKCLTHLREIERRTYAAPGRRAGHAEPPAARISTPAMRSTTRTAST